LTPSRFINQGKKAVSHPGGNRYNPRFAKKLRAVVVRLDAPQLPLGVCRRFVLEPIEMVSSSFLHNKTYTAKPGEIEQKWWHVDATNQVVGRLASDIAVILMGKHKPTYTPHVDVGDYVVVTNADKVIFTGKKWGQKRYTWYTGYTGLREETASRRLENQPTEVLREAVRRMLPKNKLARHRLMKLKIYAGPEHPHQAQQPAAAKLGKVVETGK